MRVDAGDTGLTIFYVAVFPFDPCVSVLQPSRSRLIGANRAAPFFHLIPLFGSVLAIGLLGEQPHPFHLIGFALVLTGVFVASRKPAPGAG